MRVWYLNINLRVDSFPCTFRCIGEKACMGVWCIDVWVYGRMGVWVCGCVGMGVWVYGCMGAWVYGVCACVRVCEHVRVGVADGVLRSGYVNGR